MNTPHDDAAREEPELPEQPNEESADASETEAVSRSQPDPATESGSAADGSDTAEHAAGSESTESTESTAAAGTPEADSGADEEGLPEWQPLTPEMVEDEAIRGDFMMRWAVILLAFLLGCTEVGDSRALVHIRSGEYLLSHGWLPPRVDVFSYTLQGQPWYQLSWLFDLAVAGLYAVGGAMALVLAKATVAACAAGALVHTSRPGVSTWWGSICAALALIACFPQFTATPEVITLLGVALTVRWLTLWEFARQELAETTDPDRVAAALQTLKAVRWKLPVWFVIWANLDPRMFLGPALVLLFALGQFVRGAERPTAEKRIPVGIGLLLGLCLVAALINPFGWRTLTEPMSLYAEQDPALRSYTSLRVDVQPPHADLHSFSMLDAEGWFWQRLDVYSVASLLLIGLAIFGLVVNLSGSDFSGAFMLIGMIGFSLLAVRELAPASMVAAAVATLNAQAWYQRTYRQEYSTRTSELVCSRGGRFVTVLAFSAVAYLSICGILDGVDRRRIGLGFSPRLSSVMEGIALDVADSFDDRPFNFVLDQGDLLIWAGQQVFVDSRMGLYAEHVELLQQHDQTRRALRTKRERQPGSGLDEVWAATFDAYNVTHVMPRLYGSNPDFQTYHDLLVSPQWSLTHLGGTAGVFYRTDLQDDAELNAYIREHTVDFIAQAFRPTEDEELVETRADWARPRSFYQRYLDPPRPTHSNTTRTSQHYYKQMQLTRAEVADLRAACLHLCIDAANRALLENSQDAAAYRLLGIAYLNLGSIEANVLQSQTPVSSMRYLQAVQALSQSRIIEPDNRETHLALYDAYLLYDKLDLQLRQIDELLRLEEEVTESEDDAERFAQQREVDAAREKLVQAIEQIRASVEKMLIPEEGEELTVEMLLQAANAATSQGCTLLALEVLERHAELIEQHPPGALALANLLLDAGRSEEAAQKLAQLEPFVQENPMAGWYFPAGIAALANGDYVRAAAVWRDEVRLLQSQTGTLYRQGLLATLPLMPSPTPGLETPLRWPITQIRMGAQVAIAAPQQVAEIRLRIARCNLEARQTDDAVAELRQILEESPDAVQRPLLRLYLVVTEKELIAEQPEMGWTELDSDTLWPGTPETPRSPDAEDKNP